MPLYDGDGPGKATEPETDGDCLIFPSVVSKTVVDLRGSLHFLLSRTISRFGPSS